MPQIILTDPCYYCGRKLDDVAKNGCGSEEFPKSIVDKWCAVVTAARLSRDVQVADQK
jgi:hypothetical protein